MNTFESLNNNEYNSLENKEQQSEFLSESDIELINEGLRVLRDYFNKLNPEDLPNKIAFLETSARPLLHAVKPLLTEIYTKKNTPMPKMSFLNTHRDEDLGQYILDEKLFFELKRDEIERQTEYQINELKGDNADDLLKDEYRTNIVKNKKILKALNVYCDFLDDVQDYDNYIEMKDKILQELPRELTDVQDAANTLKNRLNEIIADPDDKVLFIDDYVKDGKTFTIINDVVNGPSLQYMDNVFTYFSFFNDKRGNNERHFPEDDFFFGATSEDEGFQDYYGFNYRFVHKTFDPEEYKRYKQENERHIGVRKSLGKKYVDVSPDADHMQMKELRDQIAALGKDFVKNSM